VEGGEVITYTLTYSNQGSTTIFNAGIEDFLPIGMTYVVGSASGGGTYNSGQLTWNFASLAPGDSVTETYQTQVGLEVHAGEVMTNKACLMYGGASTCATSSVTLTGNYVVKISIYTSSGELVKTLDTFELASPISSFTVSNNVLRTDSDVLQILYQGMPLDTWDGTNTQGNKVTNGTYLIVVDSTDPFGVTTTVTQSATVLLGSNQMQFMIFNSAGEVVYSLTADQLSAILGSSLQTADYNLGAISFSPVVITPSYSDPTGADTSVLITLGSGRTFRWSGVNNAGQILTSGDYTLRFTSQLAGEAEQNVASLVTLLDSNQPPIGTVRLKPNPVYLNQTQKAYFEIQVNAVKADNVQIKIYTLAGELTGQVLVNDPGNLSQVTWDLSSSRLASGMYFADIELREGSQLVGRKILKVAILH
jgi:uncharacterized repeat protein (TIGR01451 family)